jgi:hypothetical protein
VVGVSRLAALAVAIGVVLAGCRSTGLAPVPGRGGPPWYEVTGAHFTVLTDLERDDALQTVQHLEQLLSAYLTVAWNTREFPARLSVVIFREAKDVQHFQPRYGGFYLRSALLQPLAVTPAADQSDDFAVLKHELNHHIAFAAMPQQPRWFAEGIATFFETAELDGEGNIVLGRVPRGRHFEASLIGILPVSRLLSEEEATANDPRFYASSWLLVHYLMMNEPDAFAAYQRLLAAGASFDHAWLSAFPDLSNQALDEVLARYLDGREYDNYTVPVTLGRHEASIRTLSDADVYALRATLDYASEAAPNWRQRAHENLRLALEDDPRHLRAGVLRILYATDSKEEARTRARALTAEHPGELLAWLLLAVLEEDAAGTEAPSAVDRVLALQPAHPLGLALAASRVSRLDRRDEALQLSSRALRAAPFDPVVVALRASVLQRAGDHAGACAVVRRLLQLVHGRHGKVSVVGVEGCE